jgi:putative flippase GtrA
LARQIRPERILHNGAKAAPLLWLQFVKFGSVGILATATHVLVFTLLVELAGVAPMLANFLAFCVALLVSFFGHFHWTFDAKSWAVSTRQQRTAFLRFLCVAFLGFGLNSLAVYLVVDLAGWPPLYATPIMVFAVPPILFATSKLWAFRPTRI